MTVVTRGRIPLTGDRTAGGPTVVVGPTTRMHALLTASIALGFVSLAGIFGVAVWAVATR